MSTIMKAENRAALLLPQTVNPIQYLRQLRTKHDAKSAYFIGRWFSNITASTNLQPFTVYTLKCSPNHRQSSDAVLGCKILSAVARAALSSAHLTKESMAGLSVDKPRSYKNQASLQPTLNLFTEDAIIIQYNSALAEILADVAAIKTNAVKEASTSVANNIHDFFQSSMHV
ncbi:hypothetical protein PS15m_011207 [Mucor circinelloides]